MKALVVGGTGPTGPFVLEGLLNRGYKVTILHRGTHEIDLPSEIEHLHGDAHFVETLNETLGSRTFDLVVAMYGRLRYVAEVMRGRTERLICAGGVAVYRGWFDPTQNPEGLHYPITENAPLTTGPEIDSFSYLMVQSELAVLEGHHLGFYNGTVLRFPMVYGPRQLIPAEWCVVRRILDGRKQLIVPDGGLTIESRGYAENMAYALLLCVDYPEKSAGQVYNIADEDALSLREWIGAISRMMDHEWELIDMPAKLASPSMPYGMWARPLVSETGQLHHRVIDLTKIKAQLGYKDLFKAKEGLKKTIQYYLDNPPDRGGEIEKRLNDRFDYETEDRLIREHKEGIEKLSSIFPIDRWYHPYPHPDEPKLKRDQRDR
ncbi:MAG: NAD-dependent epimerase/dehydratase family protein [Thermodesulfobacteriota bacterium]